MSTALHKEYRPLTAEEISVLREHANSADDWSQVWVKEGFVPPLHPQHALLGLGPPGALREDL